MILNTPRRLAIGRLPMFERPAFADTLRFPVDLTLLTAQNLGDLMGKYALLLAYVEQEATTWSIRLMQLEAELERAEDDFVQNEPRLLFLERWRIERKLASAPRVCGLRSKIVTVKALKERALSLVRTYDRLIMVLSRELTRRTASSDAYRAG